MTAALSSHRRRRLLLLLANKSISPCASRAVRQAATLAQYTNPINNNLPPRPATVHHCLLCQVSSSLISSYFQRYQRYKGRHRTGQGRQYPTVFDCLGGHFGIAQLTKNIFSEYSKLINQYSKITFRKRYQRSMTYVF